MKLSVHLRTLIAVLVSGLLSACSQGGFSAAAPSANLNSEQNAPSSPSQPPQSPELEKVSFKGRVSGGIFDKALMIDLDKKKGLLILNIPLSGLKGLEVLNAEISQAKGVRFELTQNSDGLSVLSFKVPIKYITKGVNFLPPERLPNGDLLPQMPSGELPSLAVAITRNSESRAHLYFGVEALGVFIETKFDPYIKMTLPVKNEAGTKTIGYFSLVPEKAGHRGGLFLSAQLPRELSRLLDSHFGGL